MRELLLSRGLRQDRAALLEDGRLMRFDFQRRGTEILLGAIFLGRVTKIIRAGAFVDLGLNATAFLPLRDKHDLHEGAAVPVRVIRDGYHGKGPTLSLDINLAGRFLVGLLGGKDIRYSKQIAADNRQALATGAGPLSEAGHGAILRRTAIAATTDDLVKEAKELAVALNKLKDNLAAAGAPACVFHSVPFAARILQDWWLGDDTAIHVDQPSLVAECAARGFNAVAQANDGVLFETRDVEAAIAAALEPLVMLPSGGEIIIQETQALTTIDINSAAHRPGGDAGERALSVNLEAAEEIGRQMGLRQLGGHFVVDFLRMDSQSAGQRLLNILRQAIGRDGRHGRAAGPTEFGLYEFTLPRQVASLSERLRGPCPLCGSQNHGPNAAQIGDQVLERLAREARARKVGRLTLSAAEPVIISIQADLQLLEIAVDTIISENANIEVFEISDGNN